MTGAEVRSSSYLHPPEEAEPVVTHRGDLTLHGAEYADKPPRGGEPMTTFDPTAPRRFKADAHAAFELAVADAPAREADVIAEYVHVLAHAAGTAVYPSAELALLMAVQQPAFGERVHAAIDADTMNFSTHDRPEYEEWKRQRDDDIEARRLEAEVAEDERLAADIEARRLERAEGATTSATGT